MNKLTKKSLALLLSSTMILGLLPQSLAVNISHKEELVKSETQVLSSYSGSCGENLTWELVISTGLLTISGIGEMSGFTEEYMENDEFTTPPWYSYKSYIKTVEIKEGVTSIGNWAFNHCNNLISVILPNSVENIGNYAFYTCSNLISIDIPNSVENISFATFNGCSSLVSISIPNSVIYIDDYAFSSCSSLVSVEIPNSVTRIGHSAFFECSSLSSVTIPNSVTNIDDWAFYFCSNLTFVEIPSSVTKIGERAFGFCSKLIAINVDSQNKNYISLDGVLFNLDKTNLIAYPAGNETEHYTIPNTVTSISSAAFSSCNNLSSVIISNSVINISNFAFYDCEYLTDIYYPEDESTWNLIYIMQFNPSLTEATIHYNYNAPENSIQEITFSTLSTATLHTSYLTQIPNVTTSSALISGSLPKGLGIYPDGTIGGIPTQIGVFDFVVSTIEGEVGYSITIQEATSQNVEADNDFEIIERIPTIDSNDSDHIFEVSGKFSNFLHVYLDGELLIRDVDYTAEEGSTKITIAAQTFARLEEGSHTINATFAPTSATVTPSTPNTSNSASSNVTVQKVAQTFEKTVPASTTIVVMPFSDVTQNDWFYSQVLFCYKNGTFSGVTETTYEPNTGMTRAMMAVVLHSLANKPSSESTGFSDVAEGEWYANAVNWLSQKGIDDSVGTFRPTDLITREETAKMLYNFCTDQGIFLPLVTSGSANDIESVSENGKLAVTSLFQRNIFGGDEFGNFNPEKSSTRAEISTVMKNFMSVVM